MFLYLIGLSTEPCEAPKTDDTEEVQKLSEESIGEAKCIKCDE